MKQYAHLAGLQVELTGNIAVTQFVYESQAEDLGLLGRQPGQRPSQAVGQVDGLGALGRVGGRGPGRPGQTSLCGRRAGRPDEAGYGACPAPGVSPVE